MKNDSQGSEQQGASTPSHLRDGCAAAVRAIALGSCLIATGVQAQTGYPTTSMRIVSPYPPGGGTDIMARAIGQKLTERSGHPVVVENRSGANGTIGAALVAKALPDGHTLLIAAAGHAASPAMYNNLPYDHARDLAPVSLLASGPLVLVVHPSLPARSVKELIALAKARPGEINVGSSGTGSLPHLSAELFGAASGIKFVHVPYKGPGAALIDVLSGQVPVYFMNILGSLPLVKAARLRALGVTSKERSPIAPDLIPIAEAGLKDFDMTNWYGMLTPALTPRDVIGRVQQEVARILNLQDFKERLAAQGMTVVAGTPDHFAEFMASETAKFTRIIKAAGIKEAP
ncbi:MAG: tripartite tricarboxylate transporter substrate binding protein [Burkholderiales bacterium]|nr:tripartite tricarboxylate transporter substrate binding protein [Burkholderiales bacterium]